MRILDWAFVGLLALVLAPGVAALAEVWSRFPYYSHGYFIPLVALWAASSKRRVLPLLDAKRDMRGVWVLGFFLLAYLAGWVAGWVTLIGLALVGAVAGAVLLVRGPDWLRTLMFPIGYLIFMVPLPESGLSAITGQLQLWVSEVGATVLQWAGEPILRRGNLIELPGGRQLFVAEACSGITSLLTLIPLGVILAYFTEAKFIRRFWLVLTVIPVALLGNLVRVILTVQLAQRVGVSAATESSLHDWVGLGTYVAACAVLLLLGSAFRRSDRAGLAPSVVS